MTLENLQIALDNLEEAKENADMGTAMMVQQIIDDTERLYERTRKNSESD